MKKRFLATFLALIMGLSLLPTAAFAAEGDGSDIPGSDIDVTEVTLNSTNLEMTVGGETKTLTATVLPDDATDKTVTWASENTNVVTVTPSETNTATATVTAVGAGAVDITAKAGEKTAVCRVTVNAATVPVESVTLDQTTLTLDVGMNATLVATVMPANATVPTVTWTSSAPAVATVDNNGNVTAVGTGTAQITAEAGNEEGKKTASCAVTVTEVGTTEPDTPSVDGALSRAEVAELLDQYVPSDWNTRKPGNVNNLPSDCANLTQAQKNAVAVAIASGWAVGDTQSWGPDRLVTRSEAAIILTRVLNLDVEYYKDKCPFTDVPDGATGHVGALYAHGTVKNDTDKFRPSDSITEAEWTEWLTSAFPKTPSNPGGNTPSGGNTSSSSSSSSDDSSSSVTTSTTKNPDGTTTTKKEDKATGTVTETTTGKDGTKTVVETKKDGTVTTTETDKAGNKTEVVEKPDGSKTTTMEKKDGTQATTQESASGRTEVKATISATAVTNARGEAVAIPMPEITVSRGSASAPSITVTTNSSVSVKVEVPVANATATTVAVIVKADGTEVVVKASALTENGVSAPVANGATIKIVDNAKTFVDTSTHWANEAISFVSAREIFSGVGDGSFAPEGVMTRAMMVTALAQFDGADVTGGERWYDKSIEWARANGVSDGSNPDGTVTREQLASMLWRYAGQPAPKTSRLGFNDASQASDYATQALCWAVENGIMSGYDGNLDPAGPATRAQVASMFARFIER